jgi:hypothetical protein
MRDRTKRFRFPGVGVLVSLCLLLPAIMAWSSEKPPPEPGVKVFPLEEISPQDCPEPARSRIQAGQTTLECGSSPLAGIAYPEFRSHRPVYGAFTFDMSFLDPRSGLRYGYAVDESRGTGTGYDRLYFDFNHDSDLTNDVAVPAMRKAPAGLRREPGTVCFETIRVPLDYGPEGVWRQTLMPCLKRQGSLHYLSFVVPAARRGKILLGAEEVELVLAQYGTITGRYDKPMTGAFLTGRNEPLPYLAHWPSVNGTFYKLLPTPAGDKIRVEPYAGPFGTFEVGAGNRNIARPSVRNAWLLSRDSIIDVLACTSADGRWNVPVGDYRPARLAVRYGKREVGLRADFSAVGQKAARPAVFPFRVRQGEPFVLDLADQPEVVFKSPTAARVKRGETLKVEAVLYLSGTDIMIYSLRDTTRKTGRIKQWDGRLTDRLELVDPTIRITNSAGQTVAEGKMPFG